MGSDSAPMIENGWASGLHDRRVLDGVGSYIHGSVEPEHQRSCEISFLPTICSNSLTSCTPRPPETAAAPRSLRRRARSRRLSWGHVGHRAEISEWKC